MKWRVKSSITNDRVFLPGDVIELSAEQAAAIPWAVEAMPEPAPIEPPVEAKPKGKAK